MAGVISVAVASVLEDASANLVFEVTLSAPSATPVTVQWRRVSGTAFEGVDFEYGFGTVATLTFAPGQTTALLQVDPHNGQGDEFDETVGLELFNLDGATFADGGSRITQVGWLLDDDGVGNNRSLFVKDVELLEGNSGTRQAVFEILLSRPSTQTLTFTYETTSGTATSGSDFEAKSGTVTFLPGQTVASVSVTVTGDATVETDETFSLLVRPEAGSAGAIANGVEGSEGIARIIADDGGAGGQPILSIASVPRLLENAAYPSLQFEVTLSAPSAPSATPVTVQWRRVSGTAFEGNDFEYGFGTVATLTFAPGQTTALLLIDPEFDTVDEADETVGLELFNLSGANFADGGSRITQVGWLLDDDGVGNNRSLFVKDVELLEGNSGTRQAVFEILLSRPSDQTLTFTYETTSDTATSGADFEAKSGTVTFLPGQTVASVSVTVTGDLAIETDETFSLLVRPEAGSAGAIANGVEGSEGIARIIADDGGAGGQPILSIANVPRLLENAAYPSLQFEVTLSAPSATPVTVQWRRVSGTAFEGNDFEYGFGAVATLTFAPGQTTALLLIDPEFDTVDEADETVGLELFNLNGANFADGGSRMTQVGWLLDDDGVGNNRSLFVKDVELLEGNSGTRQAVFEILLSRPSTQTLTFTYETTSGTATAGSDFEAKSGTVTFLPGQTVASVSVTVTGDLAIETDETFSLLVRPEAGSAGAIANSVEGSEGIARIIADDGTTGGQPILSIASVPRLLENAAYPSLQFEVTLSAPSVTPVTVQWRRVSGTAFEGYDFEYNFGAVATLTFAPGQTTALLLIDPEFDTVDEADETVGLELFNLNGATFADGGSRMTQVGWLLDDDGVGNNRSLFVKDVELLEGNSGTRQAVFEILLSRPSTQTLTFTYETTSDTATAGSDYEAEFGTVTFLPGQTVASVSVTVTGDLAIETDETFSLLVRPEAGSVTAIANGVEGSEGIARIIADDGAAGGQPILSIAAVPRVGESASYPNLEFEVTLSAPSTASVTVQWRRMSGTALAADDFASGNTATLTFAPGQTTAFLEIDQFSDSVDESDETVILELFNIAGATFAGGGTRMLEAGWILDDDGVGDNRAVFVKDVDIVEGNGGDREAVFEVLLSRPATQTLTFTFQTSDISATAGSDYQARSGTVTFLAGQTEAVVTVTVLADLAAENDETFGITLTGAVVGATPVTVSATATIRNDDIPGVSIEASSASKAEGNGGATAFTFTITRAGNTGSVQSVSYAVQGSGANAASATDFQGSALPGGSVTFAAGEVSRTITVFVNGDTVVEADEAFNVTLSNASPGLNIVTAAATGLIQNDDASVSIAALSATRPEGNSGSTAYTFTVTRTGNLSLAQSVSYGVAGTGANPATGSDFQGNAFPTGSVSFAAGETTKTITINVQGDTVAEAAESFLVSLTAPSAGLAIATGSATGTITNDEPVALGDAYVTLQQQPLAIGTTASVVINDQVSAPLTTNLMSGPAHGTLQLAGNGTFSYTPTIGFAGVDSFTYRASGVEGQTNIAEALIYVTPTHSGAVPVLNLLALSAEQQIASTYVAFFGRAADLGGFGFWVDQFNVGMPTHGPAKLFANIASSFGISPEAKALYPFLANPFNASAGQISAFLDTVYNNLFNRSSDPGGLAYWTSQVQQTLAAGQFVGSVLVNIMSGAQDTGAGKDITTLISKVAVSLAFVREQQEHGIIWAGASDTTAATQLLDPVSSDPASVLIGIRNADAYIAAHP